MKLAQLLACALPDGDIDVQDIAVDSRALKANTWWLAARGVHTHALDHAATAPPCAGVIYEPPYAPVAPNWIAYPALSRDIGEIAARFYGQPSTALDVVAVTGTDGKSSLVYLLAQALDAAMIGTIGTGRLDNLQQATHTTPDALRVQQLLASFVAQGVQRVAMEVSSHALDQHRIGGVAVDIAVFTNLSRDHLDYHHDMEAYFLAKAKLFARPIRDAVINIDDSYGRRLLDEGRVAADARVWAVSSHGRVHPRAQHSVQARDIRLHSEGIAMTLCVDGVALPVSTALLARFNVDNLLNVAACLLASGVDAAQLPTYLAALHGVPGRVERLGLGQDRCAMVDYAHTPAALANALQGVRAHVAGRLWVIFGCGGNRDRGKRPLMAAAAEQYADCVVVTDDNPRHEDPQAIVAEIMAGFRVPQDVTVIQPRDAAIRHVLSALQPHDALLIAGKGHEDYQIIGDVRHAFSDQGVVRAWCKEMDT